MTSCTSPRRLGDRLADLAGDAAARAPPGSSSTSRPSCWIARPRTGAGTAAQPGCAARAARQASTNVPASPRRASATVRERSDGFGTVSRPPGASTRGAPPTIEATVRVMASMLPRLNVRRVRPGDFSVAASRADGRARGGRSCSFRGSNRCASWPGFGPTACRTCWSEGSAPPFAAVPSRPTTSISCLPDDPQNLAASGARAPTARRAARCPDLRDATTACPTTPRTAVSTAWSCRRSSRALNANAAETRRRERRHRSRGVARGPGPVEADVARPRGSGATARARRRAAMSRARSSIPPVDADPEPNGRIDRILGKLANVDAFLTEVNRGERPLGRRRH